MNNDKDNKKNNIYIIDLYQKLNEMTMDIEHLIERLSMVENELNNIISREKTIKHQRFY